MKNKEIKNLSSNKFKVICVENGVSTLKRGRKTREIFNEFVNDVSYIEHLFTQPKNKYKPKHRYKFYRHKNKRYAVDRNGHIEELEDNIDTYSWVYTKNNNQLCCRRVNIDEEIAKKNSTIKSLFI